MRKKKICPVDAYSSHGLHSEEQQKNNTASIMSIKKSPEYPNQEHVYVSVYKISENATQ